MNKITNILDKNSAFKTVAVIGLQGFCLIINTMLHSKPALEAGFGHVIRPFVFKGFTFLQNNFYSIALTANHSFRAFLLRNRQ